MRRTGRAAGTRRAAKTASSTGAGQHPNGMRVAMAKSRKQDRDVGGKKPAKAEPGQHWYRAGCRSGRARPLRTLLTTPGGIRGRLGSAACRHAASRLAPLVSPGTSPHRGRGGGGATLPIMTTARTSSGAGLEVHAPLEPGFAEILTSEARRFLTTLARACEPRRQELLARRVERQRRLDGGERPD